MIRILKLYWKTLLYYFIPFAFWSFCFFYNFGIYDLCYSLDTYAMSLYHLLRAVLVIFVFVLFMRSLIAFYGVLINIGRVERFNNFCASIKHSWGIFGEQGVGKTITTYYVLWLLQPLRFYELQYNVYRKIPQEDKLKYEYVNGSKFGYRLYTVQKESLDFYNKNKDKIPLIYSPATQKMTIDGKESYILYPEHFVKKKRLPESNMLACEEFGDMYNNSTRHKSKNGKKTEEELRQIEENENLFKFASTHRQVSDGIMIMNDQRKGDLSIAFKGVCSLKWHLVSLNLRYKPKLIIRLKEWTKNKIVKNKEKNPKWLIRLDNVLNRVYNDIGFIKISYFEELGNEETSKVDKKDLKCYSLPCDMRFKVESRGFLLQAEETKLPLEV